MPGPRLCCAVTRYSRCELRILNSFLMSTRMLSEAKPKCLGGDLHEAQVDVPRSVRSVLPDGHVISSRHAGWGDSVYLDLPHPLQCVRQRHALTLAPRRVGRLSGRDVHHSYVPQEDAAHQLPGIVSQRSSAMVH